MLLFLLKKYRTDLLIILLVSVCVSALMGLGYYFGSLKTEHHYQQILLKQAQEYQAKQSVWLKQAEQISQQQLEFQKQSEIQANELKKEIQNVIAKDRANGTHDCTFGEYSLQHYKKSLGYE